VIYLAAFLLAFLAIVLLWLSRKQQLASGLPGGQVIYSDTKSWGAVKEPFYDPALGLTGKPDYLVEQGTQIIPVEVKSSSAQHGPFDSHIFQLAAYCLLVERLFRKRPPYGILHYPNRTFRIDYTSELESAIQDLLADMRAKENNREIHRSHELPGRCQHCGYRTMCGEKLA
jgi:CRISPR-associated exonuclease Cas4